MSSETLYNQKLASNYIFGRGQIKYPIEEEQNSATNSSDSSFEKSKISSNLVFTVSIKTIHCYKIENQYQYTYN